MITLLTNKYRNLVLALIGGSLAGLSFPNPLYSDINWSGGWLSWLCIIPLFFIQTNSYKKYFFYGCIYGFIYFGSSVIWIAGMESMAPLGPLAWLLLTIYLATYIGLFLCGIQFLLKKGLPWWLCVTTLWVLLEYARNYIISGFPWASLGYAHYGNEWLMKILPFSGIWGLTWLTVVGNCLIYGLVIIIVNKIFNRNNEIQRLYVLLKANTKSYVILLCLVILTIAGSIYEYHTNKSANTSTSLMVAALQGNINQNTSWDQSYQKRTLANYRALIEKAAAQKTDLVVWPETAFPGIFNHDQQLTDTVKQWSKTYQLNQIVGADTIELKNNEYLYYNSMIMIDKQAQEKERTSKKHLVPFGEYVPYKESLLYFINKIVSRYRGAGFTPGKKRHLLTLALKEKIIPIGGIICFESLFSQYTRKLVKKGAQLLAVITYDTWFGHSSAPAQHAIFAAYRAAETNRYVIRAGASGISGIFNNYGKSLGLIDLDKTDLLIRKIEAKSGITTYVNYGDWMVMLLIIILLISWGYPRRMTLSTIWRRKK